MKFFSPSLRYRLTGGIEAVKKEKQLQKDKENLEMLISVQSKNLTYWLKVSSHKNVFFFPQGFLRRREILEKTKVNENESCTENLVDIHNIFVQLIL